MAQLKVGDAVKLKSGGPIMTVVELYGDGEAGCVWFISGEQKGGSFPPAALEPVEQQPKQSHQVDGPIRPYRGSSDGEWMG